MKGKGWKWRAEAETRQDLTMRMVHAAFHPAD